MQQSTYMFPRSVYVLVVAILFIYGTLGRDRPDFLLAQSQGSTLVVNTFTDELNSDGDCSLREAIAAINLNQTTDNCTISATGTHLIQLAAGTYQLSQADVTLVINGNGRVQGIGAAQTIIDGNQLNRVFEVKAGTTLTIDSITITNGKTTGDGGGILNRGNLTIANSSITNNRSGYEGGGIYSSSANAHLIIENSSISNNQAGYSGGGIHSSAYLGLRNSNVSGNLADYEGGGVLNKSTQGTTSMLIENSVIADNQANYAGGGIHNSAAFSTNAVVANLINSTITGNRSPTGGGINNESSHNSATAKINIINATIKDNSATRSGAGIFSDETNAAVNIKNTIGVDGCQGPLNSYGYNLFQVGGCTITEVANASTNLLQQDPLLNALTDNGGMTLTYLPQNSSPVIDKGSCTGIDGVTIVQDQRGVSRPSGTTCDIGAVEFSPTTVTATSTPIPTSATTPTSPTTPTSTTPPTETATPTHTLTPSSTPPTPATPPPTSTPSQNSSSPGPIYLAIVSNAPRSTATPVATPLRVWQRVGQRGLEVAALEVQGGQLFVGDRRGFDKSGGLYQRSLNACAIGPDLGRNGNIGASVLGIALQDAPSPIGAAATYIEERGVFYTDNSGQNWKQTTSLIAYPRTIALADINVFYAGTEAKGIYRSDNGGETWSKQADQPQAINTLQLNGSTLWIGTEATGVWILTIGDSQPQERNQGLPLNNANSKKVYDFAFQSANEIYIATYDGIYKGDGATDWQPFGLQGKTMRSLTIKEGYLYAGALDEDNKGNVAGVWRSPLTGVDWQSITSPGWDQTYTVRDLLYVDDCQGLLAATDDGVWVYR